MAKLGLMALLNLDITRFENNMKKASNKTSLLQGAMKSLGPTIAAAFSVGAITAFAKAGFEAYQKQLEAENRLQSALGGREDIMRRLSDQANDLEGLTLFDDDAIVTAQSFFATLGLGEDAIRSLTPLVIDFAARFGMDLDAAAKAVGKAISGNGKAFKDLGFEIAGAAGSSERFNSVLNQLNTSVKGQAAELGKLPVNQIKALGVAWDNFKEDVVANNAPFILAVLDKLTKKSQELLDKTKQLGGTTSEDVEDSEFDKYAKADEEQKKVILKQWQDFYDQSKTNYEKYRELEDYGGTNRSFFAGQMLSMDILIKKAKQYATQQNTVTKVDTEVFEAKKKLAEQLRKDSIEANKQFISSVGYKPKDDKPDLYANNDLGTISEQLDDVITKSREMPVIVERTTASVEQLGIVTGAQITIWQQLGDNIKTAFENTMTFENMFMEMVNSNIKGIEEMGKAFYNMARQMLAAELAQTIGAAVRSALQGVPFPFNILAAAGAAAAAGTLFNTLVPQLAAGGIVSGPTQAIVGEYPGARSNPEVIAPLDKLSALLANNSQTVNVRGRLSGSDILISSERYSKQRTRVRGF